ATDSDLTSRSSRHFRGRSSLGAFVASRQLAHSSQRQKSSPAAYEGAMTKRFAIEACYAAFAVLLLASVETISAEAINDGQSYARLSPEERAAYLRGVVDTLIVDAMEDARHGDIAANLLLQCRKERAPGYAAIQRIADDLLKRDPHQILLRRGGLTEEW